MSVWKHAAYPNEAVVEVQPEEGGDDGSVLCKPCGDDAFDGGLHVGAVAFSLVEPGLQRAAGWGYGEAQ